MRGGIVGCEVVSAYVPRLGSHVGEEYPLISAMYVPGGEGGLYGEERRTRRGEGVLVG